MKDFKKYIKIPFKSLGRDERGCDCYGLVRLFLKEEHNLNLPTLLEYDDVFNKEQTSEIIEQQSSLLEGEKIDKPIEGAVVVLSSGGLSTHVGVMISNKMILHTTSQFGAVIEPISSPRVKNRIKGYYDVSKSYS